MAGGIAVICGTETERKENILGYRPCVGMVGGKIFFRGPHQGFSEQDARLTVPDDDEWQWLIERTWRIFWSAIGQTDLYSELTADRGAWQILVARKPYEKTADRPGDVRRFRKEVWDKELGTGGLIGDLTDMDQSPIEVITTGDLRRFIPLWENEKYLPPCQAHCPTGIPVQKRWELIRKGKMEEAVDLALAIHALSGHGLRLSLPESLHAELYPAEIEPPCGRYHPPGQGQPSGRSPHARRRRPARRSPSSAAGRPVCPLPGSSG